MDVVAFTTDDLEILIFESPSASITTRPSSLCCIIHLPLTILGHKICDDLKASSLAFPCLLLMATIASQIQAVVKSSGKVGPGATAAVHGLYIYVYT